MTTIGQTALVPAPSTSPIPSRSEIAKDLIKWFAGKYGLALWDALWEQPQFVKDALEKFRADAAAKKSGGGGGGGVALIALAALAYGGKGKRKRRGRRR